ncbi:mini-MOMP protein [Campylobacter sp. VTCC 70190]|uniref:mini-MOMP protein n=1 Tax=Campylobacter sp. VTCC 70190 TaxID=3392118 RepID=UPI00398E8150
MKKIVLLAFILNSFTFAAPLDEVFKDIEVSGSVRYRYDIKKEKKYNKKTQKYQNKTQTEITIK